MWSSLCLVPTTVSFWICCLWSLLDSAPMSEAGHLGLVSGLLGVLWCKSDSAAFFAWPLATCWKLQAIHSLWMSLLGWVVYEKDRICCIFNYIYIKIPNNFLVIYNELFRSVLIFRFLKEFPHFFHWLLICFFCA